MSNCRGFVNFVVKVRRFGQDVQSDFSVRVAYEVLSIHLKRWCNKNNLTDTVLFLTLRCLLNQLPEEMFPKLCVVVGRVIKYSRGHLALPMEHMYYCDLEINKNNINEGQF